MSVPERPGPASLPATTFRSPSSVTKTWLREYAPIFFWMAVTRSAGAALHLLGSTAVVTMRTSVPPTPGLPAALAAPEPPPPQPARAGRRSREQSARAERLMVGFL